MHKSTKIIKNLIMDENVKIKDLLAQLEKYFGKKYPQNSFSNRLYGGTIRLEEFLVITDILGYEIKLEKK